MLFTVGSGEASQEPSTGGSLPLLSGAGAMKAIRVKRIYDPPEPSDGTRILVDRLWPRGIARDEAHLDAWIKEAAPSDALRRWYSHDPAKWPGFRSRYLTELQQNPAAAELREHARKAKTRDFAVRRKG